jgi:hypothetical protein
MFTNEIEYFEQDGINFISIRHLLEILLNFF